MQLSYLTLLMLTVLVYFMWMDVALYFNLQQVPPSRPNVKPIQTNISDYTYSPFYPLTVKLLYQVKTSNTNSQLEILVYTKGHEIVFFYPYLIGHSVKESARKVTDLLFQGPTIHYIDTPLAFWTVTYTQVAAVLSANAVSILGVLFASAAARMFLSDSLRVRQLGVFMFKVRDYLDSLDGCVARARRNQVALTVEPGTLGALNSISLRYTSSSTLDLYTFLYFPCNIIANIRYYLYEKMRRTFSIVLVWTMCKECG